MGDGRVPLTNPPRLTGLALRATSLRSCPTPISPPSGPVQWLFQGPPAESKLLAAQPPATSICIIIEVPLRGSPVTMVMGATSDWASGPAMATGSRVRSEVAMAVQPGPAAGASPKAIRRCSAATRISPAFSSSLANR